jgi:hypothetical protein
MASAVIRMCTKSSTVFLKRRKLKRQLQMLMIPVRQQRRNQPRKQKSDVVYVPLESKKLGRTEPKQPLRPERFWSQIPSLRTHRTAASSTGLEQNHKAKVQCESWAPAMVGGIVIPSAHKVVDIEIICCNRIFLSQSHTRIQSYQQRYHPNRGW